MSTDHDNTPTPTPALPALPAIADAIADAVARVAPAVVAVQAGHRTASGLVWSADDGLIVTTTRLLQRHRGGVRALFHDGEVRAAELVGYDDSTELALLRVEDCPPSAISPIGAAGLRVGHLVAPVGRNIYGVRAAFGMVAGLGGAWVTPRGGAIDAWVDVDGQLPPGFSGGPLVDLAGRVIGVNTRGILREGAVLPTTTVERVATLLAAGGPITRGFLGVGVQSVRLPASVEAEAGQESGLLVTWVAPGGAAERGGLMAGDTVIGVEDRPVAQLADLMAALAGRAGAEVTVRYVRAGAVSEATTVADARPQAGGRGEGRHRHHHGPRDHEGHEERGHHGHEMHEGHGPHGHERHEGRGRHERDGRDGRDGREEHGHHGHEGHGHEGHGRGDHGGDRDRHQRHDHDPRHDHGPGRGRGWCGPGRRDRRD